MTTIIERGIGLLGGTFDPIHNGHLTVARHALDALKLSRIDFVPAPAPWQKSVATPVARRIEMIEAAISGNERFKLNTIEVMREGATYTIDTLKEMRDLVGPSTPLILIMGADQWKNFHTWKSWEEFSDLASIALCNRENDEPEANEAVTDHWADREVAPDEIREFSCGKLTRFHIPAHEASSTKIRTLFSTLPRHEAFKQLEKWLPVGVARVIYNARLY